MHKRGIGSLSMVAVFVVGLSAPAQAATEVQRVTFKGKPYSLQRRTTLASGEAAVVLQSEKEQFVIGANQFLAGVQA